MELIFALNGLAYIAVALLSFYIYMTFCKKGDYSCKVGRIIGINGIFYFLMAFLMFMWVFGFSEPSNYDFILMQVVLTTVGSVLILYSVYQITGNRNLVYLLIFFITAVFAINFSVRAFFITTLAVSYFLTMIVFLDLAIVSNYYLRIAGYFGLFYAGASIAISSFILFGSESHRLPWFLPTILVFFVFYFINMDVSRLGIIKRIVIGKTKKFQAINYFVVFGRFLVFVVSMNGFVLISSIAIHELGHALAAQYYGCENLKAVIYDVIAPHTEFRCKFYYNDAVITMAGLAATMAVAIIFMLTGSKYTRDFSFLLFGYGLLISYSDYFEAGLSDNIAVILFVASLVCIMITVVGISYFYLKQEEIFKKSPDKAGEENAKAKKA